jgi:hypothetical protein
MDENVSNWRLQTTGGIPYRYREGMTGEVGPEDANVQMEIVLEADRLLDFIDEALPAPIENAGGIVYPNRWYLAGFNSLRLNRISWRGLVDGVPIDPFGGDSGAPTDTYQRFLIVGLQFGTAPENDQSAPDPSNPETFLEITADAAGSFLTSPLHSGSAQWQPGGGAPAEDVTEPISHPITEVETEWNLRWSRIPFSWFRNTLFDRIRARLGKVNDLDMTLLGDAPPDTVLFVGISLRRQLTWRRGMVGSSPIQLDLKFSEKNFEAADGTQVTHQHLWRPGVGWQRLLIGGRPLYASENMNNMFA